MTDEQLREAIELLKISNAKINLTGEELQERQALQILLELAEQYLAVSGALPKERELYDTPPITAIEAQQILMLQGFNACRQECILALMKKMEGLEAIVSRELLPYADAAWREKWEKDNFKFDDRVMKIFSKNITQALREFILK